MLYTDTQIALIVSILNITTHRPRNISLLLLSALRISDQLVAPTLAQNVYRNDKSLTYVPIR